MNVTSLMTVEIKIDRGASLRGALRTGLTREGLVKNPRGGPFLYIFYVADR